MFNILYLHEELKILPVYIALSVLKIYRAAKKKSVPAAKVVQRIHLNFSLNLVS